MGMTITSVQSAAVPQCWSDRLSRGTPRSGVAALLLLALFVIPHPSSGESPVSRDFLEQHCYDCHDTGLNRGGLDLSALAFRPDDPRNFATWVKVFDRVSAGEMPPKKRARPAASDLEGFTSEVARALLAAAQERIASEGRATQRRLNGYEYENALRDLLSAPWLQVKGQFPDDGEAFRFNRIGEALDVSHVHMARYMSAADYAMRQAMSVQLEQPPTTTRRYYARD
jgi:hypothetical protein